MANTVVDRILRERSIKNEKALAIIRFSLFITVTTLDFLGYLQIITFTSVTPTKLTLILDFLFVSTSSVILLLLLKNVYFSFFKFLSMTLDYALVTSMLLFDPTVPRDGQVFYYILLTAAIFLFLLNLLRHSISGTLYSGFLSISLFLAVTLFFSKEFDQDIIPMLLGLCMMIFIGYAITSSNRKMMEEANTKKMMERYLPPQLVGELYKKDASLEPGGRNQKVTILFSDIRSFTTISESMPAADVVTLLNNYLSAMTDIIFRNRGTIDKFIGDAIMTIFGAPVKSEDDAVRAVRTAIEMKIKLRSFNQMHGYLENPLEIGIGIHTGEVIVGNIGSDKRLDYTVIGDNVNLASRIETMTKFYSCPILISQTTRDALNTTANENFIVREVDQVVVKGKSNSISVYEVLMFENEQEKQSLVSLKDLFEKGLQLYRERQFSVAAEIFSNLKEDRLSTLYLERCNRFIENQPDALWNGTFTFQQN